jgi:hypothetical protein
MPSRPTVAVSAALPSAITLMIDITPVSMKAT